MSNSRIKAAFQDGKAFIPFVTCGDPSLETTKKIVAELAQAGAAVIELGIPFSDPTAEGPVIQSANMCALGAGTTTDKVFDMVADLRKTVDTPFVFMTYANVVFHYGISNPEQAAAMAAKSDGAIVGSAIVKIIAAEGENAVSAVGEFARKMVEAIRA